MMNKQDDKNKRKDFDFQEALTLLNIIVEAGKHGPLFQRLVSMATDELKDRLAFEYPTPDQPVAPVQAEAATAIPTNQSATDTQIVARKV